MRSDLLVIELGSLIRRLERRIQSHPRYAAVLEVDTTDEAVQHALEGIEDAIAGLVMLHIQLRRDYQ